MEEKEQLEQLKKNILNLSIAMMDAPYHGVNKVAEEAVHFAIGKVLLNTELTTESLLKESKEKRWFR
ncbi:hypothetical protein ICU_05187 [Bacillus cereus BAG2X1-1]|nr:hypothetical protein ICU_05187 [Bacillus cereus BAG2X1-1]